MSFRTVYGYSWSENGWRMCNRDECDDGVVPGTGLHLPIRRGVANTILKGWVAYFNRHIEAIDNPGRGYSDEGSWTGVNDVGNSNHLSGTAVDLNWSNHAFRVSYSGFSSPEIAATREGLRLFEGTIWWGQDWNSPKDAMHFQLNLAEGNAKNEQFAAKLRSGYLNIWAPGVDPVPSPAPAPVDGGVYAEYGSNGTHVAKLQDFMNKVFRSYSQLDVDGDFGPKTRAVIIEFQRRVGIDQDGIVGPDTLGWLKKFGFKP